MTSFLWGMKYFFGILLVMYEIFYDILPKGYEVLYGILPVMYKVFYEILPQGYEVF